MYTIKDSKELFNEMFKGSRFTPMTEEDEVLVNEVLRGRSAKMIRHRPSLESEGENRE